MSTPVRSRARHAVERLEPPEVLRRGVGSPPLYAIVQGFVAASLYFALGLIAERAQGWTWVVMLAAAGFFVLLVLTYVEGASLHQERGGVTVIARYAFNELWSFLAGWAILLDYVLLIALTAFAATSYAGVLFPPLDVWEWQTVLAVAMIGFLAAVNVRGSGERRFSVAVLLVIADLALQALIIALGLAFLLEPDAFTDPATLGETPAVTQVVFAFTVGLVAFAGIDASSGLAGQVRIGRRGLRRLIALRAVSTVIPYLGLGLLAASALPLTALDAGGEVIERPVVGIVDAFDQPWLADALSILVAISAMAILGVACNAALLGLSRVGYSLALNRQVPSALGRLHARYHTPWVVIALGAALAMILVIPDDLEFLGSLCALGATLAFTIAHASVVWLRRREPERDRPFRMPGNIRAGGVDWPVPAIVGGLISAAAFLSVMLSHEGARIVGSVWLGGGLLLYVAYRVSQDKPLLKRITVPEASLTRGSAPAAQYGSILVPVLGTPLDDDIVQTAGRLAAEEGEEKGEGGAVIEALWVFEIPLSQPIDAPVPEAELRRARKALQRAKLVGEEYAGVEVATATTRARKVGEGIVHEAERRGVEAIVLAAEEPTAVRGGVLLGGKEGLRDRFVGDTTKYVVTKAPCRIVLTAPPSEPVAEVVPGPDEAR